MLYQFVQQHRDSDSQDIVAVGCAIRKYVAVMSQNDLSHLAVLLDAQHNATVPIEVELEITKTLVRRLSQSPPGSPDSEPGLADRLYEIVELYLNSRLLAQDKFAAVALNAILSLCLLRSAVRRQGATILASITGLLVLRIGIAQSVPNSRISAKSIFRGAGGSLRRATDFTEQGIRSL